MKDNMTTVRLQGITRHGKNRINQHGDVWEVVNCSGKFQGQSAMELKSLHKTFRVGGESHHDGRWVLIKDDPNFNWEKI